MMIFVWGSSLHFLFLNAICSMSSSCLAPSRPLCELRSLPLAKCMGFSGLSPISYLFEIGPRSIGPISSYSRNPPSLLFLLISGNY